jgi:hypothetical protein
VRSRTWLLALLLLALPAPTRAVDPIPPGAITVVGTVTAVTAPSFELRVDRVASTGQVATGDALSLRLAPGLTFRALLGEQLRVVLLPVPGAKPAAWTVEVAPEDLGRGELVDPGKGATFDSGAPEARLLVKLFAPLHADCHQQTAKLLRDLAAREPSRVRVQIFDLTQAPSRAEAEREGLTCASVLVNNRLAFTVEGRPVVLHHRPNQPGSSYRSEDVLAVVAQELARLYPPPASY